jgi:CDP-diacylglycerol--serine O-phosphatidyltransferase
VPRPPWRRRRVTDSPRPAGRRITRGLRRGGSIARRVLVGRRRNDASATLRLPEGLPTAGPDGQHRTVGTIAPTSPAVPPPPVTSPAPLGLTAAVAPPQPLLPGAHTRRRRLAFVAVNACTVLGLLAGVSAIFLAIAGDLRAAALCLIGYVACDGLDGGLARKLGVSSPFGAQMDSLVDMACCGVATPVLVYRWLSGDAPAMALAPACALVAVCAAIRLARFNVSPKDGRYFCGIPTTIVAAILALATLLHPHPGLALVASAGVLGLLMVTTFPYAKLAQLRRVPLWVLLVPAAGLLVDVTVTFLVLVGAYLASGPVLWLKRRRTA